MNFIVAATLLLGLSPSFVVGEKSLLDITGKIKRPIPTVSTKNSGVVSIIKSPGTPSVLPGVIDDSHLSLIEDENKQTLLSCRGSTMSTASTAERLALCTTSLVSNVVILEGVTDGDLEMGLRNSRHSRTLTAIFRARHRLDADRKQTLIIGLSNLGEVTEDVTNSLMKEVEGIYDAVAEENPDEEASFSDLYDSRVVSLQSTGNAEEVLAGAAEAAQSASSENEDDSSLSAILSDAHSKVMESGVSSQALDSPAVAQGFLSCREAYAKQAKAVRAKIASWKARISRGLIVDNFGEQAELLLSKALNGLDSDTLAASGLSIVSGYRLDMRSKLQTVVESSLEELFDQQIVNLEKSVLKKFTRELLRQEKTSATNVELTIDENAAAMRRAAFTFETQVSSLEVPSLGLKKDKAMREMNTKLSDTLIEFPDSPAAQLKRTRAVTKTVTKKKEPKAKGDFQLDFGLDLVAMIRPDGFGNFQGYGGYQMNGNSITVGFQNDADDPGVIAQCGGMRPPLIRVQPKLRIDLER